MFRKTFQGTAMRHRNLIMPLIFVIAGSAGVPAAAAGQAAPLQPGEIGSLAELPADIRIVIGPDVADRGGAFAAGCVSAKGEPHSRFAGALLHGDTAQVKMEYGGIAHYFDTLDFRQVNGRWVHVPKQPGQNAPVAAK
ncbi:hypothetical protein [Massilia aerilata]|uniref:Uncharacterized protein n=1 Tax=Massilia aerilata TaxID=453817 RepID=A0ABW0S6E3_9BURK